MIRALKRWWAERTKEIIWASYDNDCLTVDWTTGACQQFIGMGSEWHTTFRHQSSKVTHARTIEKLREVYTFIQREGNPYMGPKFISFRKI